MMMREYDSIEEIGILYDAMTVYNARKDIDFYVDEARAANGDVIEIGCGTGRILIPAARAGVTIAGVDNSPRMLARCKERLNAEPPDVRSRVSLHAGDMRSFDLGRTFALATIPFRPFQHLLTIEDQLNTLTTIRKHLTAGGRLIFDVFSPNFEYMIDPNSAKEREDVAETALPDGRTLRRTGRVADVHFVEQYSEVELIYYIRNSDGAVQRVVQSFPMRWYVKSEVIHLLERSGFRIVEIFGDFNRNPVSDSTPEMIFVAERQED